jgi:PAS domain S-box-containing protein
MTRSFAANSVFGLGFVALLVFVALKTQSLDFQEHSRYQARLVHLQELDARLNADVFESRFELTTSYDSLVAVLADLDDTQAQLANSPGFVSAESRAQLTTLLVSHVAAAREEATLVERFKSENAILRNTLHYLPIIYTDLASSEAARSDVARSDSVNDFVREVLLYNLTGDPETARSVRARRDQLAQATPDDASPSAYQLRMLVAHVGVVLSSKPLLDGLLAQIVAVPTTPRAALLQAAYSSEYDRALGAVNFYRFFLVVLVTVLVSGTVFILARLRGATIERRRSEARNVAILKSALDGVLIVDARGAVIEFNPAAEHTFGYSGAESHGKLLHELVVRIGDSAIDLTEILRGDGSALLGRRLLGTGRRADGTEIPLELAMVRIDCDGPSIFTAYLRDISERRTAELALQQSQQALIDGDERRRLVIEAAQDVIYDCDPRPNGVITWSPSTHAMFGYEPAQMGATLAEWTTKVHPDDRPRVMHEMAIAFMEGGAFASEYRHLRHDGSYADVLTRGKVLLDERSQPVRAIGAMMDITIRKLDDEALRNNEERFRNQYKGFPLPTYTWLEEGDDFVLQDFNDAAEMATDGKILGALGRTASTWYADVPDILADLHACVAEQRTLKREMGFRYRTTGQKRQLVLTFVFVPPRAVMIHTEDLTDARQADQQREAMAQSEKLRALGQMASGIAHDLNQSLMLVASYSDLARQALVEDPPNLAELEDLLTTTTQAALDGGLTVKRLLLFTRAAPQQDSQPVDLSKVVHDAAQLTAPRWRDAAQAAGNPISLHIEAAGHPTIQGSAAQLRELLTNIIFNAVDALPTGGTIRLRVAEEDKRGIIEVFDSGVGMTAEVCERIFEPFFTTKGEGGTGLGLAMVFGIVEQHGGHINVRSAPGAGTTFRISMPLLDESTAVAQLAPTAPAQLETPRSLRVLVVDDEPMMTKAVVRMLRPAGHTVSVAGSGEEALDRLAEQTFDVVVSDMGMGAGMNGWELAEAVKGRWPGIRFLLATGWGAAIATGEARARGVEAVLAKPYHPTELLQALARTDRAA